MTYDTTITLDMSGEQYAPPVTAKQGDKDSRYIIAKLIANGTEYILPDAATAKVSMIKPRGQCVLNDAEITDNSTVKILLTEQMLIDAGDARAEVMIYRGDAMISSAVFDLRIMPSSYDQEAIESAPEYNTFIDALSKMQNLTEKVDAATEAAATQTAAAEEATSAANDAADTANSAASAANSATSAANTARDAANDAADVANSAASAANTAASAANTAADRAGAIADDVDGVVEAAINAFAANALSYKRDLGTDNLNTITEMGIYGQMTNSNATTARNYPASATGWLIVLTCDNQIRQFYVCYSWDRIYFRKKSGSTWFEWSQTYQETQRGGTYNNYWIKHSDGTMMITQKYDLNISDATRANWGAALTEYYSQSVPPNFSQPFVGVPFCTYSIEGDYSFWVANNATLADSPATNTRSARLSLLRPQDGAAASGTVTVTVNAIGRWK